VSARHIAPLLALTDERAAGIGAETQKKSGIFCRPKGIL
jgi:hypothetical protein